MVCSAVISIVLELQDIDLRTRRKINRPLTATMRPRGKRYAVPGYLIDEEYRFARLTRRPGNGHIHSFWLGTFIQNESSAHPVVRFSSTVLELITGDVQGAGNAGVR